MKILNLVKTFTIKGEELKNLVKQLGETGEGRAQISLIGVKDHDDDIAAAGSFGTGQWAHVLPTHNWGSVPLGKALIVEEGGAVFADFKLNLEIEKARDWHSALKFDLEHGEPIQEWSYGLHVKEWAMTTDDNGDRVRLMKEIEVHEVSPVVLGAGSDTGTVDIKNLKDGKAVKHTTATSAAPWSSAENLKNGPKSDAYVVDEKFLHHFTDVDGSTHEASIKACLNSIEVINGTRGGATVPEDQKQATYDHLAQHLKDAGVDAPEFNERANSGLKLADEMSTVVQFAYDLKDRYDALVERVTDLKDRRNDSGRTLSDSMVADIAKVHDVVESIKGLETVTDPTEEKEASDQAANLLATHAMNMHRKNLQGDA